MLKTAFLFFTAILFTTVSFCQTWNWFKSEPNGTAYDNDEDVHDIETDSLGNVYVLGDFRDSLYLGGVLRTKDNGSFLVKYDSTGKMLWYKTMVETDVKGPYQTIHATDLLVTSKGIYVTGRYYRSFYEGFDLCTTNPGNKRSYRIGDYDFVSEFNETGLFMAKLSFNGRVDWNKVATEQVCFGTDYIYQFGVSLNPLLTSDKENNVFLTFNYGSEKKAMSVGPDLIPLAETHWSASNYIVTLKYDYKGNLKWSQYAWELSPSSDGAPCVSTISDDNGNIFLIGTAEDGGIFGKDTLRVAGWGFTRPCTFIAKITKDGRWAFAKSLSTGSWNTLNDDYWQPIGNPKLMTTDKANNVFVLLNGNTNPFAILGDTLPWVEGQSRKYLLKMNDQGHLIYRKPLLNDGSYLSSISFANDHLYITGAAKNVSGEKLNFGNILIPPSSNSEVTEYFMAMADTSGSFNWATTWSGNGNSKGYCLKVNGHKLFTAGVYPGSINNMGNFSCNNKGNHNMFVGSMNDGYTFIDSIGNKLVCAGGATTISFKSEGISFSNGNTFTAELSDINGNFGSPIILGSTTSTSDGVIYATIPKGLPQGSGYLVRLMTSDKLASGLPYYAYSNQQQQIAIGCPAAVDLQATAVTSSGVRLSWGSVSCVNSYKVQYKKRGTPNWTTVKTDSSFLKVANLLPSTTYQWRVGTICKSANPVNPGFSIVNKFTTSSSTNVIENNNIFLSNEMAIKVSPNPAGDVLTIQFEGKGSSIDLSVLNIVSQLVKKKSCLSLAGRNTISLDVASLRPGLYFLTIRSQEGVAVCKFIKE